MPSQDPVGHSPVAERVRALARRVVDEMAASERVEERSEAGPDAAPHAVPGAAASPRSIALGADHGGFRMKESLESYLAERGFRVEDCGTHGTESVDYPDFAAAVARRVADGRADVGIVVDGAGIGSSMAANKIPGVRAASCYDISSARNSREHNHANVLTLGAGLVGEALARQIVDAWLETAWGSGRHARRVEKIDRLEEGVERR